MAFDTTDDLMHPILRFIDKMLCDRDLKTLKLYDFAYVLVDRSRCRRATRVLSTFRDDLPWCLIEIRKALIKFR